MTGLADGTFRCDACGGAEAVFVDPAELAGDDPFADVLEAYHLELETKRALAKPGKGSGPKRRRRREYDWRRPDVFGDLESVVNKHNMGLAA